MPTSGPTINSSVPEFLNRLGVGKAEHISPVQYWESLVVYLAASAQQRSTDVGYWIVVRQQDASLAAEELVCLFGTD